MKKINIKKKSLLVYDNFFDLSLLKEIDQYASNKINERTWRTSQGWPQNIKRFTSPISILELPDHFLIPIRERYRKVSKKFYAEVATYYIWPPGSYIGWHSDSTYSFTSTTPLNEKWDKDHGGIFLYEDSRGNIKGILPVHNKCVINMNALKHTVTMLTPDASLRRTLLVFGKKI